MVGTDGSGQMSRALGGGNVKLNDNGINANDWNDDNANDNIGCAGSGSSRGNFYLPFNF